MNVTLLYQEVLFNSNFKCRFIVSTIEFGEEIWGQKAVYRNGIKRLEFCIKIIFD